jgi:hypothetical protein
MVLSRPSSLLYYLFMLQTNVFVEYLFGGDATAISGGENVS